MSAMGDINAIAGMVEEHNELTEPARDAWERVRQDYNRFLNSHPEPEVVERVLTDMLNDLCYFEPANTAVKVVLQNYARLLLRKMGLFEPNDRREHTKMLMRAAKVAAAKEQ